MYSRLCHAYDIWLTGDGRLFPPLYLSINLLTNILIGDISELLKKYVQVQYIKVD